MPKDKERRRRGRRGGRRGEPSNPPPEERREEEPLINQESEAPGVLPSRFTFRRGRKDEADKAEEREKETARLRRTSERPAAGRPASSSPLSFWRRGQARPYRQQRSSRRGPVSIRRRITGFQFPAWVPVSAVIVVVFGILGLLFFARSATGSPRSGDHWHATYEISICGQRQPNIPTFPGGVHTHGSGTIHMHPNLPSEEGSGARLVKFIEYGGGRLTQNELRIPGQSETVRNGDQCDDGSEGLLQVFVNGRSMDNWSRYIPQDGDSIRILFGMDERAVLEGDGIVIPPEEATREIEIEASDRGVPETDSFFDPNAFTIDSGETVKVNVTNTGTVTHNLRVEGVDKEYRTDDDFVTRFPGQDSALIGPGEEWFTVVRIEEAGQYAFRCDIHPNIQFGTLTVAEDGSAPPQGTSTPEATSGAP